MPDLQSALAHLLIIPIPARLDLIYAFDPSGHAIKQGIGIDRRMKILVYENTNTEKSTPFLEKIDKEIPSDMVEMYHNRERLLNRVLRIPNRYNIIVLFCDILDDFKYFISMRDTFRQYRIILVIPDREADTIKQAHQLYPRYLTYSDNSYRNVIEVLKKMVSYINQFSPPTRSSPGLFV